MVPQLCITVRSRLYHMQGTWVQRIPVTCLQSHGQTLKPGLLRAPSNMENWGWPWSQMGHGGLLAGRSPSLEDRHPSRAWHSCPSWERSVDSFLHVLTGARLGEGVNGARCCDGFLGGMGPERRAVRCPESHLPLCLLLPPCPDCGDIISCQSRHQITGNCSSPNYLVLIGD